MEKERKLIRTEKEEVIPNGAGNTQFNPADLKYHPEITKQEVLAVLAYESGRFFREWGNV